MGIIIMIGSLTQNPQLTVHYVIPLCFSSFEEETEDFYLGQYSL